MNKINSLLATLLVSVVACGCGGTSNSSKVDNSTSSTEIDYVVNVRYITEKIIMKDYNVELYDGSNLVASGTTIFNGRATITAPQGEYDIKISNLPEGYFIDGEFKTSLTNDYTTVVVSSTLIEAEKEAGTYYKLDDVAHDFYFDEVISDGEGGYTTEERSLSEIFAGKKAVMINYWATWCGPCRSEFPLFQQVYEMYSDDIEIIALNSDSRDTVAAVGQFGNTYGLSFTIGRDVEDTYYFQNTKYIPATMVIDRHGIVYSMQVGAYSSISDLFDLFDVLTSDAYDVY